MTTQPASPWRKWARAVLPPVLTRWLGRRRGAGYAGDYASWTEALRDADGYETPVILERVVAAAREVRDGRAAFERDSVTFPAPDCQWPLLACLLRAQARRGGELDVVDFGGSLGSLYFQHRSWLKGPGSLRWRVVEQPHFVAAGKREFENGELSFHATLDDACAGRVPDGIILSSVLPYLEQPHALLAEVARRGFSFVLIDRTGLVERGRDRLTVQRVSPEIYPARYPCWFLVRGRLAEPFRDSHVVAAEWSNADWTDLDGTAFGGLCLERRASASAAKP